MIKYLLSVAFFCLASSGCSVSESNDNWQEIQRKFNQKINLVYVMTTWCSASKEVLEKQYPQICSSDSINTIILCGNNEKKNFEELLDSAGLDCSAFIIPNASNFSAFHDRRNIRGFLREYFKQTEKLDLEGSYAIPLSFYVDENLNILSEAPQLADSVMNGQMIKHLKSEKSVAAGYP